jgi:hypothetical protein
MSGTIQTYLKRMARLTGRKFSPKHKGTKLPKTVEECLNGIQCHVRHFDPEDGVRVLITMSLVGNFMLGGKALPDEAERRVKRAFPDLSDRQVGRAAELLRVRAINAIRERTNLPTTQKKSWAMEGRDNTPIKTDRDS